MAQRREKMTQNLGEAVQNQDDAIQMGNKGQRQTYVQTNAIEARTDIYTVNTHPVRTQDPAESPSGAQCV